MSTSENPSTENPSTSIQPDVSEERTLLPPPPQAPPQPAVTPEFGDYLARLDVALVVLLLGLTFLVGLFRIGNSDFYQNLAVGRLLAHGEYRFGEDPFSWTSEPTSWANALTGEKIVWVNHHWLFGLLVYGLYTLAPAGQALVLFRGILLAALAGLLVLTGRRPGQRLWTPALCAVLALVVVSARVYLQPVLLTYLFLGVTLWLLERPRLLREARLARGEQNPPLQPVSVLALALLFVLWVNVDNWFFLGPVVVALYLVGALLARRNARQAGADSAPVESPARLALVLGWCLGACLLNPFHVHAFTLPAQLGFGRAAQVLSNDPYFSGGFASPLVLGGLYYLPTSGLSVAGMSYFGLLALSIVALVLAGRAQPERWHWARALVLLFFALLSLYSARAIPFFAIVAGPITALNFQLWWERLQEVVPPTPGRLLLGRWLGLLAVGLLLLASVPGWLQARPHASRRLGWTLAPDPSVERLAEQIKDWRQRGLLGDDVRWYNSTPDLGNYLAWYCPGERTFIDSRLSLFPEAARDRALVRNSLGNPLPDADKSAWREVFERRGIRHVLYFDYDIFRDDHFLTGLLVAPVEWPMPYRDGKTTIFVWNKPDEPAAPALAALKLDMRELAFGPKAEPAPEARPDRPTTVRPWYAELWEAPPARPLDAYQGRMDLLYFQHREGAIALRHVRAVDAGLPAAVLGMGCQSSNPLALGWPVPTVALRLARTTFRTWREADPVYVGLRAARRALAENPNDAQVHLLLGQLYFALSRQTLERPDSDELRFLKQVRLIQTLAALQQAVKLDPDLALAHEMLAALYQEMGYLDLVLKHRLEWFRWYRELGPRGWPQAEWNADLQRKDKALKDLENEVQNLTRICDVQASNRPAVQQATLALSPNESERKYWLDQQRQPQRYGLAEKALEGLEQVPEKEVGPAVAIAQIDLLFRLGRLDEIREILDATPTWREMLRGHPDLMNLPAYEVFQVLLAAASGDYDLADEQLGKILKTVAQPDLQVDQTLRKEVSLRVGRMLQQELTRATAPGVPLHYPIAMHLQGLQWQGETIAASQVMHAQLARGIEVRVLRGWLALEGGQLDRAREYLRQALKVGATPEGTALNYAGRSLALMGLEWLNRKR